MGRWRVSRGDLFVISKVRQGSLAPAPAAIRLAYDRQRLNPHAAGLPGVWCSSSPSARVPRAALDLDHLGPQSGHHRLFIRHHGRPWGTRSYGTCPRREEATLPKKPFLKANDGIGLMLHGCLEIRAD
jgi:hypothetical protein